MWGLNPERFILNSKKVKNTNPALKTDDIVNKKISNPIDNTKILPINPKTTPNKLYSGYINSTTDISVFEVSYSEIINIVATVFSSADNALNLFYSLHNAITEKFNPDFSAFGIYNQNSGCIDLKLCDKIGSVYNSKIMLNDTENPIVQAFVNNKIIQTQNSIYLKLNYPNYFSNNQTTIIPLSAINDTFGVMIFGGNNNNQFINLYKLISNYFAIFYKNEQLLDIVDKNTDIDSLTGLFNHKKLQENLSIELKSALEFNKHLAFCLIDIADITEINNELGHAKGDFVIKEVAGKIKKNARNTDILGRYGGDKIAIIMPDTSIEDAKYVCEFLLYNLSCTMFNDLGQVKFSCGIAIAPYSTDKQDKLVLLAQQALYIAKSKRAQSGQSEIVSTLDYNFWDSEALIGYVKAFAKKHAAFDINIDEELINQFHNEKITSKEHLLDIVSSLVNTIDAKDPYTKGHSSAVSRYSEALARAIDLPEKEVEKIKLGALLHDIGKIGIPEHVLKKPTKLNDEEWETMKQHPAIGANKVLKPNKSLHDFIPIVKYHHEHIDGKGYPEGLKGDEIPLSARIVAVADAYHALISDRPYRKALSVNKACEILKMGADIQWDRELVRQFVIIAPSLATNTKM